MAARREIHVLETTTPGRTRCSDLGVRCAFCHSTVDDSFAPGIGHRQDGWANRDLNVGAIVGLAPDLSAITTLLGFYHDGRFADLAAVVDHYNQFMKLALSDAEKSDLMAYLKSL